MNYSELFDTAVKEARLYPMSRLLARHGILPVKGKQYRCFAHDDKNPSLSILPEDNALKCFGCGFSGDVIKVAQHLTELPFKEAINHILERQAIPCDSFSQSFPSTKANPNFTAYNYLLARALVPERFAFEQGNWNGKATVKIRVSNGLTFHRLIDWNKETDSGKTRFEGNYAGKGIVYQSQALDWTQPVIICEGIFNLWSLQQALGLQGIATLTTSNDAKVWFENVAKDHHGTRFVLAFDNDDAGKGYALKMAKLLDDLGLVYEVAFSPAGNDWNDLLQTSSLTNEAWEKARWQGKLFMTTDVESFHAVYSERYQGKKGFFTGLLEFSGCYWSVSSTNEENPKPSFYQLSNFIIQMLYSVKDESIESDIDITHIAKVVGKERTERLTLTANDIASNTEFKRKLLKSSKEHWLGVSATHNNLIVKHLLKQVVPIVRKVHALGYDQKSHCFVFGKFLYDIQGKRYQCNEYGYFEKQNLLSIHDETVLNGYEAMDIHLLLHTIQRVYGVKAWLVLGYCVASLFSYVVHEKYNAFPFFSLFGVPQTGKTTLINVLINCLLFDWQGLAMNDENTRKGVLRNLAKKKCLPIPLLENNGRLYGISENSLLNAYHWGALYERARTTNDTETHSLPFQAGLLFIQNVEPFGLKAVKQRVCSVEFFNEDITETSREAMKQLRAYKPTELAFLGHTILTSRMKFEQGIVDKIESFKDYLEQEGIDVDRIAFTHAVSYAGFSLLTDLIGFPYDSTLFASKVKDLASKKLETAIGASDLAEMFLEAFETLKTTKAVEKIGFEYHETGFHVLEHGIHYLEDDECYYIRLSEVIKIMNEKRYPFATNPRLYEELKRHETFKQESSVKRSKSWSFGKDQTRVWIFKR